MLTAALLILCLSACGHHKGPTEPDPEPAPQLACAASISVTITGQSTPVTYPAPTVTGGQPPVSVSCSPASGSAFSIGTNPVTCTTTDSVSRQALCSFNVVVKGVELGVKKFLAVGDSTTEGENGVPGPAPIVLAPKYTDTANAYPVKLQALFDASYPGQGITVAYTKLVGGNSSATTLGLMNGYLNDANPEAVLILTGYNDLLTNCRFGSADNAKCDQAIDDLEANVRGMIRTTKAHSGVRYVFFGTVTPGRSPLPGFNDRYIDPLRVQDANEHLRAVITAEGAVLVDLYPVFLSHENEYVSGDGLHLNPPGYQAVAQTFFDKILATVPKFTPQFFRR